MPPKGKVPPHLRKFLFKKKGRHSMAKKRKSAHRSHTSTALVRQSSSKPLVIRQTRTIVKKPKHRRRHHGGGHSGGKLFGGLKLKGELAGWGSLLGYLETSRADLFEKIPTFKNIPREAVIAVVANYFGRKHKHIDRASAAAAAVAGYKFGANGFSLSGLGDE